MIDPFECGPVVMARRKRIHLAPTMGGYWVEFDPIDGLHHWKAEFKASKRIFTSKGYKKAYRAAQAANELGMKPRFDSDGEVKAKPSKEWTPV